MTTNFEKLLAKLPMEVKLAMLKRMQAEYAYIKKNKSPKSTSAKITSKPGENI